MDDVQPFVVRMMLMIITNYEAVSNTMYEIQVV